ncbi:MAG: tetratricopeptide repeat protein [Acidobacteriota bacterium]
MRNRSRKRLNRFSAGLAGVLLLTSTACVHRGVTPIRTHFNQGVYHYAEGDYEAAISAYRLALEEDPSDLRSRFNLAEALETQATRHETAGSSETATTQRQEAEEHYRTILTADPDHLRATVNLAAREVELGKHEAAETRLRTAMERHPRAALPHVALAAHRLRSADPAQVRDALAVLEEALAKDPANLDANMLLGHACTTLARLGDPAPPLLERAREAFERVTRSAPSDLGALLALARLERQADQPEQALPWLRRALYIHPDLLEAHLMLSELLATSGELEGATVHLWRSRELEDPQRPRIEPAEYQRRLLDLYRRLAENEQAASDSAPP